MLGFLIAIILAVTLVAVLSITLIFKLFTEFQPGSEKINEDLRMLKLKAEKQLLIDLAPFDKEDYELLSLDKLGKKIKRRFFVTTGQGIITSIYEEPLITYAYKKYISPGIDALMYARSSKHEYVFRITNKGIAIQIDGKKIGVLKRNGVLYNPARKMIARINKSHTDLHSPIFIGEKEVGSLVNPKVSTSYVPRALDLVDLNLLNEKEEEIFSALATLELAFNTEENDSLYNMD